MNAVSEDIVAMLEVSSVGYQLGVDLFVGREPTTPDNTVTIFDTPGGGASTQIEPTEIYYRDSVQLRIRNNDYRMAMSNAYELIDALHNKAHEIWNDTYYSLIRCSLGPHVLDFDENNRPRIVITFDIQRR